MHAIPERTQVYLKTKLPVVLPVILPVMIGVSASVFIWRGALIPFNPAQTEFFVYLSAAIILLGALLIVAGGVMALLCGLRSVSCTVFRTMTVHSIMVMAAGLLVCGVVLGAA